jgi:hypothetical protein
LDTPPRGSEEAAVHDDHVPAPNSGDPLVPPERHHDLLEPVHGRHRVIVNEGNECFAHRHKAAVERRALAKPCRWTRTHLSSGQALVNCAT